MKALIFAAGLGKRMRPLTEHTPKPLLAVGGVPLIVWHLRQLAALGIREAVINTSWLAAQFPATLGDGHNYGMQLHYSFEGDTPLETGGGMLHALPLLGDGPFLAINGDIWSDVDFARLPREPNGDAHLVLTDNPAHHPRGDFTLESDGRVRDDDPARPALTFTGIGVYRASILHDWRAVLGAIPGARATPPAFSIVPLLRAAMARGRVSGEHHTGRWTDVGTPERLRLLDAALRAAIPAQNTRTLR